MKELVVLLRLMQFYSHNAHNLAARIVFHQDHEFFAELYQAYEDNYDDVVERMIGLMGPQSINLNEIQLLASQQLQVFPLQVKENGMFLEQILKFEKQLCLQIEALCKTIGLSQGSIQLLGDIGNASEKRQYKIKQRLSK